MRLVLQGFDSLEIGKGKILVLEVRNPILFSRFCQSFSSNKGEFAVEPYSLWEDGERIGNREKFLFVADPFNLPWDMKGSVAFLHKQVENVLMEDEGTRLLIDEINERMRSWCFRGSYMLHADYAFKAEWDIKKYLKAFAFGVDYNEADKLLDNLIKFLNFAADAHVQDVIAFVNLCNFLAENEMEELFEHAFFLDLPLVLLEGNAKDYSFANCMHYRIDQELVGEYM